MWCSYYTLIKSICGNTLAPHWIHWWHARLLSMKSRCFTLIVNGQSMSQLWLFSSTLIFFFVIALSFQSLIYAIPDYFPLNQCHLQWHPRPSLCALLRSRRWRRSSRTSVARVPSPRQNHLSRSQTGSRRSSKRRSATWIRRCKKSSQIISGSSHPSRRINSLWRKIQKMTTLKDSHCDNVCMQTNTCWQSMILELRRCPFNPWQSLGVEDGG